MDFLSTKLMLRFWHLYHAFWHWVCEWSLLIDIHVLTTEPGVGDSGSNNYSIMNLSYKSCQALTIVSPNDLRRAPPIMNFLPHGQKASSWNACGCKNWDFLEARTGKPPRYLCHSVFAHMIWHPQFHVTKICLPTYLHDIFMISSPICLLRLFQCQGALPLEQSGGRNCTSWPHLGHNQGRENRLGSTVPPSSPSQFAAAPVKSSMLKIPRIILRLVLGGGIL